MFGDCRSIVQDGIVLGFSVSADDKKFISSQFPTKETNNSGTDDDQRERNMEKEDGNEGRNCQCPHHFILQSPASDADYRAGDNREHGWLQTVKDRCDPGQVSIGYIDIAEPP